MLNTPLQVAPELQGFRFNWTSADEQMRYIATIITCHNRKAKTLACLDSLFNNTLPEECSLKVFLVDDGSTDGTEHAVRESYPQVHVIKGDGSLFWNGGMRVAFSKAMEINADYYLWLNDDTMLYPDAVARLLAMADQQLRTHNKDAIVVGSTQSEIGGPITYGGVRRTSLWRPLKFSLISPGSQEIQCYTMNGNCVLIPQIVARVVGNLDPAFTHTMGDMDYGLRATKAGFAILLIPGYAGTCSANIQAKKWMDTKLSFWQRFRKLKQVKGLPPKEWFVFTMRHGSWAGPIYWVWPYVKVIVSGLYRR